MGITAFPFSSVIDVPTARILGRDDAGTGSAEALTTAEVLALLSVYTTAQVDSLLAGKSNTGHTHTPADITGFGEAVDDEVATLLTAGTGISLSYDDNANTLTIASTVTPGVGGSTGSVDNAALRADGTGGATLQASAIVITDNFTSSPNATVNHASIQATGATTNVSMSVVPKGTGSFSLHVPDGTATGGNARGANAVDLQTSRGAANQVASGDFAFAGGGRLNVISGSHAAIVGGQEGLASGPHGFGGGGRYPYPRGDRSATIGGEFPVADGQYSCVLGGNECQATGSAAIGHGERSLSNRWAMRAFSGGMFAAKGDCQGAEMVMRGTTTTNAAVRLRPDGSTQRLTIASGQICQYLLIVTGVRNGGADVASYMRQVTIKNVGGTTSLVGTVNTIGVDNAAGTSLSVTADDTNDDLAIEPTGVSGQTWRWECVVYGGELRHG